MAGLLRSIAKAWGPVAPDPKIILIGERQVQINFRINARAKRMILRLSKDNAGVIVTLPKRVTQTQALGFVEKSIPWIAKQLESRTPAAAVRDGSTIPLRGVPHLVRSTRGRRGLITIDPNAAVIHVPGDATHMARRLKDWLKKLAKTELSEASAKYARAMDVTIGKISIRDQQSRWGSCSPAGDLSYSWRLILAPSHILDYVAAHEVAHRQHMNHGPKFWRLVLTHCPNAPAAKQWFKQHGSSLHQFKA
jgi:predicted metal-dependent hydrolase